MSRPRFSFGNIRDVAPHALASRCTVESVVEKARAERPYDGITLELARRILAERGLGGRQILESSQADWLHRMVIAFAPGTIEGMKQISAKRKLAWEREEAARRVRNARLEDARKAEWEQKQRIIAERIARDTEARAQRALAEAAANLRRETELARASAALENKWAAHQATAACRTPPLPVVLITPSFAANLMATPAEPTVSPWGAFRLRVQEGGLGWLSEVEVNASEDGAEDAAVVAVVTASGGRVLAGDMWGDSLDCVRNLALGACLAALDEPKRALERRARALTEARALRRGYTERLDRTVKIDLREHVVAILSGFGRVKHTTVGAHFRRGHWANLACGEERRERRKTWRRPTWVHAPTKSEPRYQIVAEASP